MLFFVRLCSFFFLVMGIASAHAQRSAVHTTAYTSRSIENGGHTLTAAGTRPNTIVAAASPDVERKFPLRTIIKIVGPKKPQRGCHFKDPGYRVVLDRTSKRLRNTVDLLFRTVAEANHFGRCSVHMVAVGQLPDNFVARNQAELALFVSDDADPVEVADAPDAPLPK